MVSQEDITDPKQVSIAKQAPQSLDLPNDAWDPDVIQDEAIREQESKIEAEVAEKSPLIGDTIPLDALLNEYAEEDHIYRTKIMDLKNSYESMRKSRPDGNCFFRAFGFSLFHSLLQDPPELDRMFNVANQVLKDLRSLGFSFTVDDFHEIFVSVLQDIKDGKITNVDELLSQVFNDRGKSDYLVVFLRLVTSSHLQKNADFFAAFIEDGLSVKEFCSSEVEPMFKESDHIHVIAITSATGVGVRINYLDRGGTADKVNIHNFPEQVEKPRIHLLYRPGHYDVLYVKQGTSFFGDAEGEGESLEPIVSSSHEPNEMLPGNSEGTLNFASATARSHSEVSSSSPGSPSSQGASSSKNPRLDSLLTGQEDSNEPSTTS